MKTRRTTWISAGVLTAAVLLTASVSWPAAALPGPSESTTVNVAPERVLDTRDPIDLGLPGPFVSQVSQKLQITGSIPTSTGTKTVVPTGASGVLLNVTGVRPSANGFVSIRPGDATGAPTTSSLNLTAGATTPNAVQVSLPTAGANAGKIDITYDALGQTGPTTEMLIDIVGYTTSEGLQAINTEIGDIKTDLDDKVSHGDIVMTHGAGAFGNPAAAVQVFGQSLQNSTGSGFANMPITGPGVWGGVDYGLKSITYCLDILNGPGIITSVVVSGSTALATDVVTASDGTDRTVDGCYTVEVNDPSSTSFIIAYQFSGGGGGDLRIYSVTSTWAPDSEITTKPTVGGDPLGGSNG